MLSRAQEARIRALIWTSSPGTLLTYCLEHLATSAKIPASHMSDLAVFVRSLHERGDCQRRFGGFCEAGRHETRQTLVWGPPPRLRAAGTCRAPPDHPEATARSGLDRLLRAARTTAKPWRRRLRVTQG